MAKGECNCGAVRFEIDGDLTVSGGDLLGVSNLNLAQDLTVTGNDIYFGNLGARINA